MADTGAQRATAATIMKPSQGLWMLVHVAFPLLPFFLEAVLRFTSAPSDVSLAIFSVPNLAMSIGLLAFFVSQSLANTSLPLRSGSRQDDIEFKKLLFIMGAIACFVFFGALIREDGADSTGALSSVVVAISALIVFLAYRTQKEFKLKAVI